MPAARARRAAAAFLLPAPSGGDGSDYRAAAPPRSKPGFLTLLPHLSRIVQADDAGSRRLPPRLLRVRPRRRSFVPALADRTACPAWIAWDRSALRQGSAMRRRIPKP